MEKTSNFGWVLEDLESFLDIFLQHFLPTHLGLLSPGSSSCYRGFESRGQLLECARDTWVVIGKEVVPKGEIQRSWEVCETWLMPPSLREPGQGLHNFLRVIYIVPTR